MSNMGKLFRLLPLYQSQEMLLTWGLILLPHEHREFAEKPSWPVWKRLMVRDLTDKMQAALDAGDLTPSDLHRLAEQTLTTDEVNVMPLEILPAQLAAAWLNREVTPESQVGMIQGFLEASINGDEVMMANLVEAANEMSPPSELDAKELLALAPVERVLRVASALAA